MRVESVKEEPSPAARCPQVPQTYLLNLLGSLESCRTAEQGVRNEVVLQRRVDSDPAYPHGTAPGHAWIELQATSANWRVMLVRQPKPDPDRVWQALVWFRRDTSPTRTRHLVGGLGRPRSTVLPGHSLGRESQHHVVDHGLADEAGAPRSLTGEGVSTSSGCNAAATLVRVLPGHSPGRESQRLDTGQGRSGRISAPRALTGEGVSNSITRASTISTAGAPGRARRGPPGRVELSMAASERLVAQGKRQSMLQVASRLTILRVHRGGHTPSEPLIEDVRKLCPVEVPKL